MNELNRLVPIIERHTEELKIAGVISIRPGYRLENGWPTKQPAIVVVIAPGVDATGLPSQVEGVPVDIRPATPAELLRHAEPERYARLAAQRPEFEAGAFPEVDPVVETDAGEPPQAAIEAAKPHIPYTPAPGVSLSKVTGTMRVVCHASPDAGWPTLREFMSQTQTTLTVGLYDFTSDHILKEVEKDLAGAKTLVLTLDQPPRNPTADHRDTETVSELQTDLGTSFEFAWALVEARSAIQRWIYPSAYHIKVAVRDSSAVWLSSGNWNNSNQPDMDPINNPMSTDQKLARNSDRDWHVIIEDQGLAKTYEAFLKHDFDVAAGEAGGIPAPLEAGPELAVPVEFQPEAVAKWTFFPPLVLENESVTVTPLLTPDQDVYAPAMLDLIRNAQERLFIQLQYIHPSDKPEDAGLAALVGAVADKINSNQVDVRIIVSEFQRDHGWLERLQAAGVDLARVKIQNHVHNKAFVVDSTVVALGSQNWSGDGVLRNRDASVIIENARAAAYFESIFQHDWDKIAVQSVI